MNILEFEKPNSGVTAILDYTDDTDVLILQKYHPDLYFKTVSKAMNNLTERGFVAKNLTYEVASKYSLL